MTNREAKEVAFRAYLAGVVANGGSERTRSGFMPMDEVRAHRAEFKRWWKLNIAPDDDEREQWDDRS